MVSLFYMKKKRISFVSRKSIDWVKSYSRYTHARARTHARTHASTHAHTHTHTHYASEKGRWAHHLIPKLEDCIDRRHGEVNYYLTQLLTGHGCFRAYLYRFKLKDTPGCPVCLDANEDAEHVFCDCSRY